jgi:hypothetical protein
VVDEAAGFDWDMFKTAGAEQWVIEQVADSPDMLRHEVITREAAVDYVRDKTMVILDPARRAEIIDAFVSNVERNRRQALDAVLAEEEAKNLRTASLSGEQVQTDAILDEGGVLW